MERAEGRWITAKNPFSSFSLTFLPGEIEPTWVFFDDGQRILVHQDEDDFDEAFSEVVFLKNPLQKFRIESTKHITMNLYNFRETFSWSLRDFFASTITVGGLRVISREEWGAEETMRYDYRTEEEKQKAVSTAKTSSKSLSKKATKCDNLIKKYPEEFQYSRVVNSEYGKSLYWPYQYSSRIHKIVVHHTAESAQAADRRGKEVMRSLYSYHTKTRGWGDIGYNYVIDHQGNIYEGRAGGDAVVGAHVYCNNVGTLGIALMGNFQHTSPDAPQVQSLNALVHALGKKYHIDPAGASTFHGELTSNFLGHRDLGPTSCPGEKLYKDLPRLRLQISLGKVSEVFLPEKTVLPHEIRQYAASFDGGISVLELPPRGARTIQFRFKNTGTETWKQGTWLHVKENTSSSLWADSVVLGKNYVAADLLEEIVPPGKIGTFPVTMNTGYQSGLFTLEFSPVINGTMKISSASVLQPVQILEAKTEYEFVNAQGPKNPIFFGQKVSTWVRLKNTGNTVWYQSGAHPVVIAVDRPVKGKSRLKKSGDRSILGNLKEEKVSPGETGTFLMEFEMPERVGKFRQYFTPIIPGVLRMNDVGMHFIFVVKKPQYTTQSFLSLPKKILPGESIDLDLTLKNTSDVAWKKEEVVLKVEDAGDLFFSEQEWSFSEDVPVGQQVLQKISVVPPLKGGWTNASLQLFQKNTSFDSHPVRLRVRVTPPTLRATVLDQSEKNISIQQAERISLFAKIENTGNVVWTNGGANKVSFVSSETGTSKLYLPGSWETSTRVTSIQESIVRPGETATVQFEIEPLLTGRNLYTFFLETREGTKIQESDLRWSVSVGRGDPRFVLEKKKEQLSKRKRKSMKKEEKKEPLKESKKEPVKETTVKVEAPLPDKKEKVLEKEKDILMKTKEKPIRIRLSFPLSKANIIGNGGFSFHDENGDMIGTISKGNMISFEDQYPDILVKTGGMIKRGGVFRVVPHEGTILQIQNWDHAPAWNSALHDNEYRGVLEIRFDEKKLTVINELPLEHYLWGLAEVQNNQLEEKRKTLAVLARTYALFYLDPLNRKFSGKPYDGSDDPDVFQKYLGYGYEKRSPNFKQSVKDTEGEVVIFEGKVVKTPYFNESDGRTRSAEEVWGWTHTPYLLSVPDMFCGTTVKKGHGVGLSGCGATKLAEQGKSYKEIISYYYSGVKVEKR